MVMQYRMFGITLSKWFYSFYVEEGSALSRRKLSQFTGLLPRFFRGYILDLSAYEFFSIDYCEFFRYG